MKKVNAEKLQATVQQQILRDIEWGNLSGAAAIVLQEGEPVCRVHLGYRDIEAKEVLSPHTLFRLASLTKPITAVASLIGVEKGWFSLEDKVSDYFPEIRDLYIGKMENGQVIPDRKPETEMRLFHLLSHSSGFLSSNEIGEWQRIRLPKEAYKSCRDKVRYALGHICLSFEPGSAEAYSAYSAFDMIACLLEEKSGMSYPDFLQKYLFDPLEIQDITFNPTEEQWSRMITMVDKTDGGDPVPVMMGRHTFEGFPLSYTCAGASLAGTIEDYVTFGEMIRRKGSLGGVRILNEETIAELSVPRTPKNIMRPGMQHQWGLGVRVTTDNDILPDGCFGWSGAYGTHFWVDPENEITAVYMKNTRWHDSHGGGETAANFERAVMSSLD